MLRNRTVVLLILALCVSANLTAGGGVNGGEPTGTSGGLTEIAGDAGISTAFEAMPWWGWALLLFVFTLFLGVVAVITGLGGGLLYVPVVSALFPFSFDFVRGAGLMVALCGALAAGPKLLKRGLASMELGLPFALLGSVGSVLGARLGLVLPDRVVQTLLGFAVIFVVVVMTTAKKSEFPNIRKPDRLATALGMRSIYNEESLGLEIGWATHRTVIGMLTFVFIGFMGGMFGVGGGWANVPALNLLLGAPLKVAIATSGLLLTINSTAAVWVYLNNGAVLPLIVVPSVAGMMIGTTLGARLLPYLKPRLARWFVIGLLLFTGVRYIIKGFSIIG